MKLFVWKDVLTDYTSGIAFALAENADEARKLILDKYEKEQSYISDKLVSDLKAEPLVIDSKEGFYVLGGG
jgi:GH35 family endo-1,4-beta-xylanase